MPIGLSSGQLTRMRAQVALMLPETAVISAPTQGTAGPWIGDPSYAAVAGGTVSCRRDPLGGAAGAGMVEYNLGKETIEHVYQLTVPYDAPLAADYRVTIDSTDYEIIQMDADHSWNVSRRAVISEVE